MRFRIPLSLARGCSDIIFSFLLPIQFGKLVDATLAFMRSREDSPASQFCLFVLFLLFAYPGILTQFEYFLQQQLQSQIGSKTKVVILNKILELSRDFQTEKRSSDASALVAQGTGFVKCLQDNTR